MAPKPPKDGSREQELQKHLFSESHHYTSFRQWCRCLLCWHTASNGQWLTFAPRSEAPMEPNGYYEGTTYCPAL